jgi:hypothetical protein
VQFNPYDVTVKQLVLDEHANSSSQTVVYERRLGDGRMRNWYHDQIVRLWQEDPDPATVTVLERIQDVDRLEALCDRILEPDLRGWDDLLRGS